MYIAATARPFGDVWWILHDAFEQLLHLACKSVLLLENGGGKAPSKSYADPGARLNPASGEGSEKHDRPGDGHYFALFDNAPDAFLMTDAAGSIVEANNAASEAFGLSRELLCGKNLGAFVSEPQRSVFKAFLQELPQSSTILRREMDLVLADRNTLQASVSATRDKATGYGQERFYWIIRFAPTPLADDAATGSPPAQDDEMKLENKTLARANTKLRAEIKQREKAEQKIREQNDFLNHVIESLPHPFYVLDAKDFTIKMANSATGKMTAGATCYALTHHRSLPCDGLEHRCPLQEVKATKKPVTVEHIHFDKDGNPRNVEVHGYPIFDEYGEVVQMIESSIDITERKQMEAELEKHAEKIKLFAYTISHDLKTPIIGVHGLVELLDKKYGPFLDDKGKQYCEQILKASRQMMVLIEELNVFIQSKEAHVVLEPTDVGEVLETIRNEFGALLDLRKISWFQPDHLPTLMADKLSLLRIFRNLVENALKYGGDHLSEIRIGCESTSSEHIFSVRDNGVGIPLKDCESVFELFKRKPSVRGVQGSGLGLAIVKELATRHGGRAWAEPNESDGAAFFFSIAKNL